VAYVTIVFIMDGEKCRDEFCHFDGTTELSCKEYFMRKMPKKNIEIIEIKIVNHWEKENE